jgi:hypothetical protein
MQFCLSVAATITDRKNNQAKRLLSKYLKKMLEYKG